MNRNRKKYKELVVINGDVAAPMKKNRIAKNMPDAGFYRNYFSKT